MHCQCSVHSSTGLWPALTVPVRASGRYLNVQCGPVRCAERARKPYRVQYVSTILLNMYKQLYRQSYKQPGRPTLSISIYLSADPDPCRPLHVALRDVARRFPHAHISNACVGFGIRRSYRLTSSRSHPTLAKVCERVKRIQTERGMTEIFYATRGVHWCNKKNHDKIRGVNHSQLTLPFKNVHT